LIFCRLNVPILKKGFDPLENEAFLDQFAVIEKKVEELIGISTSLQTENLNLHDKIKLLEEELDQKKVSEQRQVEEKALIRSRIDNLLAKLEGVTRS
jgi:regulator of replication initiation timing